MRPPLTDSTVPKFSRSDRQQLTPCCGCYSTYCCDSGYLVCKKCYCDVDPGQGDGSSFLSPDGSTLMSAPTKWQFDLETRKMTEISVAPATLAKVGAREWRGSR